MASIDAMAIFGNVPVASIDATLALAQSKEQAVQGAVILDQTAQPLRSMTPFNIG